MRLYFLLAFILGSFTLLSQVNDDFSDGDFTNGTVWSGTSSFGVDDAFEISESDNQLRSQNLDMGSSTRMSYLSTSDVIDLSSSTATWSFRFRLGFSQPGSSSTNSNNTSRVYLMSNSSDLNNDLNGYYIELRYPDSDINEVRLYRQDGGSTTELTLSGTVQPLTSQDFVNVTVNRSEVGLWEIEVNSTTQGTVADNTYASSTHFGVQVRYTANSRDNGFYFDDFATTIAPVADTSPPTISTVEAISDVELKVTFSEGVEETSSEDTGNYVVNNGISVTGAARDATEFNVVTLTISNLTNGQNYNLEINNVEDLSGNVIAVDSEEGFQYLVFEMPEEFDVVINEFMADPDPPIGLPNAEYVELYNNSAKYLNLENWTLDGQVLPAFTLAPDAYVLVVEDDDAGLFMSYSNVITIPTLSLNNTSSDEISLEDDGANIIFSITYSGSTDGTSLELINPNGPDYSIDNYGLSENVDGGTPEGENSIFDDTPDSVLPEIATISVVSATEVSVTFSEKVEESTAETIANYGINGGVTVTEAMRDDADFRVVSLTVSTLTSGITYTVTINGVEDLSGNAVAADSEKSFFFVVFEEAAEFDVVINEFMADPEPAVGLPAAEYVELYNRSSKYFDLGNWTLDDQSMPSFTLGPDEYVIVVDDDDETLFTSLDPVIVVSSLGLSNAGDEISLADDVATEIHSIAYETSSDGISTELINPNGPDYSSSNYGLSESLDGGTPGVQNSIFDDTPDTTPPTVRAIEALSETEVLISFSENVEKTTAELIGNYAVDNGISVTNALRDDPAFDQVTLTTSAMTSGTTYTLTINGLTDLSGNVIDLDTEASFLYVIFEEADEFDVIINEFMADPDPAIGLPEAEYVELFNRSAKYFNLDAWTLDDRLLPAYTLAPNQYVIVVDDDDESLFNTYSNVVSVSSLSLNNSSSDVITLADDSAQSIYSLEYFESTDGTSTELINPNGPDYSIDNYGLSENADGGTPGVQNSIFDDTPDTTLPEIVSVSAISATELSIVFSEKVEELTAETGSNYILDNGAIVTGAVRADGDFSRVNLTVSTLTSGTTYAVTVDNVEDLSGNTILPGSEVSFLYVVFEEADEFDVVINEFMANPDPVMGLPNAEFVELYNRSSKYLNVEGWSVDDRLLPSFILAPDSFTIVVDDDDKELFDSFPNVLTISSLNLNNSGVDEITLADNSSNPIYSVVFSGSSAGISTELINPNGPDYSSVNYGLSEDPAGGTPGAQNSIFDDTPDSTAPILIAVEVISDTHLAVYFDEFVESSSASNAANYSIDVAVSVTSAELDSEDQRLVHLEVSVLTSLLPYTLTVNNVEDLSGNPIINGSFGFEYIATEAAVFGDVVVNEFMADPTPASELPEGDFVEILNVSEKYLNLEGWVLADDSNESDPIADYILAPGEYLILSSTSVASQYESFGATVGVAGFPNLNEGGDAIIIADSTGLVISEVRFSSSLVEDAVSAELLNPQDPCISETSYRFSASSIGATPGAQNSVFDDTPDEESPVILSAGFQSVLTINFSEKMDAASLLKISNYEIENLTIDIAAVDQDYPRSVEISFSDEVIEGITYEMSISGLTDCWGNEIEEVAIEFGLGRSPTFNELLITELLYDPRPAVGLPEHEYLEIYNNTSDLISTEGLILSDATSSVVLPSFNLEPATYYVMTSSSGVTEFSINAIGVGGIPSFNDSGELLTLTDGGELIFSIEFDPNWQDEEKEAGGYSLEMVDITNPCLEGPSNWRSSNDPRGGTPGEQNSLSEVIPDSFGPEIVNIVAISSDTIKIDFTEKVDPSSIQDVLVTISPLIDINTIYFDNGEPQSCYIILEEFLPANQLIEVSLENLFDCSGNEVSQEIVRFALPLLPVEGEIKLSEVLFNPRSGGVDFVEIFNDSENYLSIKGWQLARITDDSVSDEKVITIVELVIDPGGYLAFTTDTEVLLNNYPKSEASQLFEVASLPGYNDNEGTVVLINALDEIMEQFSYSEEQHYDLLEDDEGVSLERISFAESASNASNWRSASSTEGFATPGYANSQAFVPGLQTATLVVEPKVFIPGNAGSGRDFTTINYEFQSSGQFANVNIYDQNGRLVRNLVQGELLSTTGFLRWDGETNDGSMARMGYYVVLFEVYNVNGNTEVIKETVVVGRDF